jgi:hypothetical protein
MYLMIGKLGCLTCGVFLPSRNAKRTETPLDRWSLSYSENNWPLISILSSLIQEQDELSKGKAIPVTSRGGQYVCETSRLPHFLDNRLTDGGEVINLTSRSAALHPQKDSWYSFLLEAELTPGP